MSEIAEYERSTSEIENNNSFPTDDIKAQQKLFSKKKKAKENKILIIQLVIAIVGTTISTVLTFVWIFLFNLRIVPIYSAISGNFISVKSKNFD
jgi:hypothetical protein